MSVPQIDYDNFAIQQLPSAQRKPYWIIFIQAMLSQVKRLYGIFVAFMNGEALSDYASGTTYAAGAKVKYQFATWESLQGSNIGHAPDQSPTWWLKRNNSFIGATERAKYNGKYLNLTYELNRYFNTTFRQPPYPSPYGGSGTFSDIYITNDVPVYTSFVMYPTASPSSKMYPAYSPDFLFDPPVFDIFSTYKFIINVPTAVWNTLGATDAIRETVVRNFVDKYYAAGTEYKISTY